MSSRLGAISLLLLVGLLITFLGGCGPSGPISTPTPTKTPRPLVTPVAPPTKTPVPPTPTPTSTPEADRCPLTGEVMEEPEKALRRPLIVKIGNDKRSRPQSGLQEADIVIEHLTEGGITRLDAVYLCHDSEKIGPVRSARLIDIPLAYLFDGIFAHAGASPGVLWVLNNETNFPRLDETRGDPGFERGPASDWPYNTFTRTSTLWQIAEEQGWQHPMQAPPLLFGPLNPATKKEERAEIVIPYFADNRVSWQWDDESQRYLRFTNGVPQTEATTGEQIKATNVIIIWAEHKETPIIEDEYNYVHSLEIVLNAKDKDGNAIWSKAFLLRDGYFIPARWIWQWMPHMLELSDEEGNPLPLAVGNSWIEVVPLTLEIEAH